MVSIGSLKELAACCLVQKDAHHKRIWIAPDVDAIEAGTAHDEDPNDKFFVLPLIELPELVDQVDEMVRIEGLTAIGVGIHDICAAVGRPFDVEHADVWRLIDKLVNAARPRNIDVWVNTGYRYKEVDEVSARISRLWDHGICTIQVQGPEYILYHVLNGIRSGATAAVKNRKLGP